MLQRIKVSNYAIIDEISIDFCPNLNIITGETGAGKTILLGALGLILGQRADNKTFFRSDEKCVIEAEFAIEAYGLQDWFETNDLDYQPLSIIRRELQTSGKNRVFINDTPVNLQQLQDLAGRLVDIHQQFSLFDIQKPDYQQTLFDAYAGNKKAMGEYSKSFHQWQNLKKDLLRLRSEKEKALQEMDFVRFQLDEIESIRPENIDQATSEEELKLLENAGNIRTIAASTYHQLIEDERSIIGQINTLLNEFSGISHVNEHLHSLSNRLMSTKIELQELASDILNTGESIDLDEERAQAIREQLDQLYRLLQKHRVDNVHELLDIRNSLLQKNGSFDSLELEIQQIESSITSLESNLRSQAKAMSERRKKAATPFCKSVLELIHQLGMPHATISVEQNTTDEISRWGYDHIQFLFSANKGSAPAPIRDVASGGEISRLTLVIKSLVASTIPLPTMIFDEIDTGLGGEIALKMSEIMHQLATEHQLIVITHSPQIAARADKHLFVYKEVIKNNTFTQIKELDMESRIEEIAVMLSTRPPGKSAIENAKELIKYK